MGILLRLQPFTHRDIIHCLQPPAQAAEAIQRHNLITGGGLAVRGGGAIDDSQLRGGGGLEVSRMNPQLLPPTRPAKTLKWVPKGARRAAASLLHHLLTDVTSKPECVVGWTRLLGFTSGCLRMPERGGKNRNFTAAVLQRISCYAAGEGARHVISVRGGGGGGGTQVRN